MIIVLDNRDSFVFNLARHFQLLGVETAVIPSHGTSVSDVERMAPAAIVISPGPCTPAEAGCSVDAVRTFRGRVPLLGVCLGHQAVATACGGVVGRAAVPVHGRASDIYHDGVNLFAGIPNRFRLLANFLERAGVPHAAGHVAALDADVARQATGSTADSPSEGERVVTF